MGAKATTKPAAINDRRIVRLAMRPKLLSLPVRKQRLISLAVALPLIAVVFATPVVARLSSLSFIFDSCKLALAKNRSVTAKHSPTIKTAELGQIRFLPSVF
jgi:hypothetical protein